MELEKIIEMLENESEKNPFFLISEAAILWNAAQLLRRKGHSIPMEIYPDCTTKP